MLPVPWYMNCATLPVQGSHGKTHKGDVLTCRMTWYCVLCPPAWHCNQVTYGVAVYYIYYLLPNTCVHTHTHTHTCALTHIHTYVCTQHTYALPSIDESCMLTTQPNVSESSMQYLKDLWQTEFLPVAQALLSRIKSHCTGLVPLESPE